jgi:hypothetical protein
MDTKPAGRPKPRGKVRRTEEQRKKRHAARHKEDAKELEGWRRYLCMFWRYALISLVHAHAVQLAPDSIRCFSSSSLSGGIRRSPSQCVRPRSTDRTSLSSSLSSTSSCFLPRSESIKVRVHTHTCAACGRPPTHRSFLSSIRRGRSVNESDGGAFGSDPAGHGRQVFPLHD